MTLPISFQTQTCGKRLSPQHGESELAKHSWNPDFNSKAWRCDRTRQFLEKTCVSKVSRRVVYRTRVFNVCGVRHWFHTTNHSGFACLSKFNFLKKYARTFTGYVKKLSGTLFFSALSVLHNFCSELGEVFVGTVFPSPLPSANMRPNLAIEQD